MNYLFNHAFNENKIPLVCAYTRKKERATHYFFNLSGNEQNTHKTGAFTVVKKVSKQQ
jgi:hypothetical protein